VVTETLRQQIRDAVEIAWTYFPTPDGSQR
jgi:hypothetical protein